MRSFWVAIAVGLFLFLLFVVTSGGFLVKDDPKPADAIVVLAGETDKRPARALALLGQQFAPRIIMDVPYGSRIYSRTIMQLAEEYIAQLPQKSSITICPTRALSTRGEAYDVDRCLESLNVRAVLLVTSDFHTRRALSTFSHELPGYRFSIAAAYDPEQFGPDWWRRRQWAKTNLGEWFRLVWWEAVDRWRHPLTTSAVPVPS
jgi:uncharacterized SAM-binding protein YcdF (DUF218 family)